MDHGKLFKVLVIGGAMLGMGCVDEAPPTPVDDAGEMMADAATDAAMVSPGEDASMMGTDAGATDAGATDAGELVECGFCPTDACCETDDSGHSTTRAGMMCCWGTSC